MAARQADREPGRAGASGMRKAAGGMAEPSGAPAIDLVHLSIHTLGDAMLERDVLRLFAQQAESIAAALARTTDAAERRRLCHLVKGSARGVGAFEVARTADRAERSPQDGEAVERVLAAIGRARAHIDTLLAR